MPYAHLREHGESAVVNPVSGVTRDLLSSALRSSPNRTGSVVGEGSGQTLLHKRD